MLRYIQPDETDLNELNYMQKKAYKIMLTNSNMFLTGPGGTGKSYLIEKYYEKAIKLYGSSTVAKTSTTGISALNIKGRTIHSWAGVGFGTDTVDELIKNMSINSKNNWQRVRVLIIDEVSMLHPDLLDKLYEISNRLRKKTDPPIQFIFVGDPFQLPVVKCTRQFFEARCWPILIKQKSIVQLSQSMRQKDEAFQNILNFIRIGRCTAEIEEILMDRVNAKLENSWGIKPTNLHSTNKSVKVLNDKEINALIKTGVKHYTYTSNYTVSYNTSTKSNEQLITDFKKESNTDDEIILAIGAQVMFKKNMRDINPAIVNGARGIVEGFEEEKGIFWPIVRLINGFVYTVKPAKFEYRIRGLYEVIKMCIPLKLAWACSIHSSQGLTLDYAMADLGSSIFDYGQSYVVLSRVKNIESLSLIGLDVFKIKANPVVLKEFYPEIYNTIHIFSEIIPDVVIDNIITYLL